MCAQVWTLAVSTGAQEHVIPLRPPDLTVPQLAARDQQVAQLAAESQRAQQAHEQALAAALAQHQVRAASSSILHTGVWKLCLGHLSSA